MSITVCNMKKDEIETLTDFRLNFLKNLDGGEEMSKDFRQRTIDYMTRHLDDESFRCVLAKDGEKIVGTAMVCFYETLPKGDNTTGQVGYILNVFTDPTYRGQGIATQVLNNIIEDAKQREVKELYLRAEVKAIPLYERLGFMDDPQDMVLGFEDKHLNLWLKDK